MMVGAWTVLRHVTNGVNFDVVGQIGLAQQWASGTMAGAQLGTTNYLVKMPLYICINAVPGLSPMHKILLAALVLNVITFIALFLLLERIVAFYGVKQNVWLYIGVMWLASIAGNIFWIDYANSRNIETVGGLLFLYIALRFMRMPQLSQFIYIVLTGSIVFFVDTLQLYICGVGVSLYALATLAVRRTRQQAFIAASICAATILSYFGAQALFLGARRFLHVSFLNAPRLPFEFTGTSLISTLHGSVSSSLQIMGANLLSHPFDANSIREVLNLLVLGTIVGILILATRKKKIRPVPFVAVFIIVVNYVVYVLSGQANIAGTYRYLIMIPLFLVLLLACTGPRLRAKYLHPAQYLMVGLIFCSSVMVLGGLVVHWPQRHAKDAHIYQLVSYLQQHNYPLAIGSRETGVTATYFAQQRATILPFGCSAQHQLEPTFLFYDRGAYSALSTYEGDVPVLLQNNRISFGNNICYANDIISQIGQPIQQISIPGFGSALIYSAAQAKQVLAAPNKLSQTRPLAAERSTATLHRFESCPVGKTDIIVAHTDDDILFMNPDVTNKLRSGVCIRTVYITAGDDGRQKEYWLRREQGIRNAYAAMLGLPNEWTELHATINGRNLATYTLNGSNAINVIFMRLPDGGVNGDGFRQNNYGSLKKLSARTIHALRTVDDASTYTYPQLTKIIATIIATDNPNDILTTTASGPLSVGDHSDHKAVALIATRAATVAHSKAHILSYVGYTGNSLVPNLSDEDALLKREIFSAYAYDDDVICSPKMPRCSIDDTYGKYFYRNYKLNASQLNKQVQPQY
ncbi:MAG: PIG-L family deacetylase [Patescibacteria group bacterium]|nr:PIG-L family deacetylase [Patescibacteria group bacterium]